MGVVALAIAAVFVAAVVWLGRRRGTLGRVTLAALAIVGVVWGLGIALMFTGWKDIDGWIDCHPHCHGWHRLGGSLFWFPPAFVAALLLVSLAAAATARRR